MDYFKHDLASLHDLLVKKEVSVTDLVKETLTTIKERDQKLAAFLTLNEKAALDQAAQLDQQGIDPANILAGIPLAIKDNIVTKDLRTTAASKILENFQPIYDATVMEKLAAQQAITIGKTNLDEFAMGGSTENSAFKTTKNAWDQTKVPGGSSGGSAAAVASGEVMAALGSDTGGSIRQPAAFNGIVGVKPTYGRVSRYGLIAFASSLDQIGTFTRNVKDNALLLNAISGLDPHDSTSSSQPVPDFAAGLNGDIKGMKIAVPKEYLGKGIAESVKTAIKQAISTFEKLGATVDEVSLPHSKYGVPVYYIIASSEASSNLQRFDGIRYGYRAQDVKNLEDVYVKSRSEGFGDEVKRRIMLGTFSLSAGTYDAFFKKAAQVRTLICQDFAKVFGNYDLILGPTAPTTAFGIGEDINDPITMYMNDILTIPVNLAGLPGMSLPAGFANGLPIGLQLIANQFAENTMYRAGYAFEQATDFHKEIPAIGGQK
ncbi:MAG: Asp-tRNA(Asn)/Glu-tRNA(Gln) amidotransferase subunit GatA [Liquorilactobacillus nagelii]|jgi:aspartyl-tRNA(Asn)/glutamyl-tRNA(Gln) amidotransferase subunit A|uniref:Glutamyl-tRNA(Gln) amidotransferase subunit A n=1 Tax=Liquorilactobacillus nagelii TaxID=82688 RepID=A0A3S6QTE6_9LACO|nr:Asp-tRNA(Asn)/Glu-tRNA(Gln) amidotransferase subunit GatA [Liquorilactobacillus nagelii]AUJ31364.1 aspartyl/glutamyl-tRNA amidotransferase subunit A [Liquorilactobacillus nagelii]MCC7616823.1 Asp-tRNA(Asn)/Glu-tRNA(Gln) amidotransferase GatCAB subunit A [Liquorilactobacillus nagelii]MCI1633438.1 Asp-tRNA(Asn)/Glu-tRNA(Gln) amidotransferase subunit GatA [Liquorilactobacillus nagelii]MCI1922102.1 Asp-tRNA(Asn)/Glu-tRNA(Gln) amidotransferase subunit GatA [Liquorilactobacillus nagelii]MCI197713